MGYMDTTAYFCETTKIITGMANASMHQRHTDPPHTLEAAANTCAPEDVRGPTPSADAQWHSLSPEVNEKSTAFIDIYLIDFISIL